MQMLGLGVVPALLALHLLVVPSSAVANVVIVHHKEHQPADEDPKEEADRIANEVTLDAQNAHTAADVAKQAAVVANTVAEHSVKITHHAKKALGHALHALHEARVDSQGLDTTQKDSLKKAEGKLREATKTAEFGKLKKVEDKNAADLKMDKMQAELDKKKKKTSELEQMRSEVKELRRRLKENDGDTESDKELQELESEIERLEKAQKAGKVAAAEDENDEMKAEIERLRDQIDKLEEQDKVDYTVAEGKKKKVHELPNDGKAEGEAEENKELMRDVQMKPLSKGGRSPAIHARDMKGETTPVEEKGIDIDTQMPYGDLEPFGREDTAQELTESSVRESDEMVDQLERAEVAEEKRSVFRALTRLRGAAITSFDGVARSQTGNIDEYNKIHKWRKTHPLHHLADEESDITKWAFPDNADLMQMKHKAPVVAKKAMSQLQIIKSRGIKDPCAAITCAANLKCPAGFAVTEVDGHCCPYCFNPNIKLAAAITGATGSNGGKASTFCPKVWCFPTSCTKALVNPTTTNGACCATCPA